MWVNFCKYKSYSHFFSKNISVYAIFNDQSFNDTSTNDIVSFEPLGPDIFLFLHENVIVGTYQNENPQQMFSWRNKKKYTWYPMSSNYWLWLGKLTALDMTPLGWLGSKTSTQTN